MLQLQGIIDAVLGSGLLWLLGIILFAAAVTVLICGREKKTPVIQEITLQDLSTLWTKDGDKTIQIAELSPLWRDEKVLAEQDSELPDLQNSRALAFRDSVLQGSWFAKSPQQKDVCGHILKLLDQEGNCPSVVNLKGDVEGSWDENTYQILARTTLLDHSLNVAEHVVQLLQENESGHVTPDTVIAALGHDLGKLESVRGYLYSVGEHPLTAGRPLGVIPGFKTLPKKEEILRAIKHHHKRPSGLLGKTLKKADQLARQKELEEGIVAMDDSESITDNRQSPTSREQDITKQKQEQAQAPQLKNEIPGNAAAAWQAQSDIYGDNEVEQPDISQTEIPKLMDISAWFDAEDFLNQLRPYINKMFGRRFMAFSMPDGHVYFQTKVLEEVARKQAERAGCMEIATMGHKDPTMRQVLLTIVHQLRRETDIIARGLIKDNFFGGYFTVTRKTGKNMTGYYTPFHAEAFGSIAEMEQNKSDMLRDIQKVEPCTNNSPEELY